MRERGFIHAVRRVMAGAITVDEHSIGDSILYVDDAVDFDETGGTLVVAGNEYTYTAADIDDNFITLGEPLQEAVTSGENVYLLPLVEEIQALVIIGDNDEALQARIPFSLSNNIPDGLRDEGFREGVEVEMEEGDDEWVVKDVFGKYAIVEGMSVDVTTLPGVDTWEIVPDGFPPDSSPTPEVIPMLGALMVKHTGVRNHDRVTYKVYMSTTTPVAVNETNLVAEGMEQIFIVDALADDTPLEAGTTYHVVIVASDVDGDAAPSVEASGSPVPPFDQAAIDQLNADLATLDAELDQVNTTASGKNKIYRQDEMPTGGTYQAGDMWFDTNDDNRIYVHDGTAFVDTRDAGIEEAISTADQAIISANGKNKTIYSQNKPPGVV